MRKKIVSREIVLYVLIVVLVFFLIGRAFYLQVVKGNTAAKNLYTSLGFEDFYTYWFRSKEV